MFREDVSFFFNDTATTEIYTLSLHDALPIWLGQHLGAAGPRANGSRARACWTARPRSEEHTSELQSRPPVVCRLLPEKKTATSTAACACSGPGPSGAAAFGSAPGRHDVRVDS